MPIVGGIGLLTNKNLFIKGYPDGSGVSPLFIGPANRENIEQTLFTTGPVASDVPLFIGFDQVSSGSQSAYILGTQGFGGSPDQLDITLRIEGTDGSLFTDINTLTLLGPEKIDDNSTTTLFTEAGSIPTGSGTLQFFTEGASATTTNPVLENSTVNLFIRNEQTFNSDATLYVEKDFNTAETSTLFLKSNTPSGVATLYSSGVGVNTASANLLIKAPEVRKMSIFSRGYN